MDGRGGATGVAPAPLLVFYDGDCGLCTGLVAWALARDRGGHLRAVPARSDEARARSGAPAERLLAELHVWSGDGGTRRGVDAVAALLARLPRWRWLGALLGASAVRPVAEPLYRFVARRRAWFGVARCPVPGRGA